MQLHVTDQLGTSLSFAHPPKKIVSIVPSQTELLYALGLEENIIGITTFCVHPAHLKKTKQLVGGTKKLHLDKILALAPDLIVANKEENTREQVMQLAEKFPVYTSDISTLEDALQMIADIGHITQTTPTADKLIRKIRKGFEHLAQSNLTPRKAAYLIWRNPYMTVGRDTFIHDILQRGRFENVFAGSCRYPEIGIRQLQDANCDVLLCSTEPYPFKAIHLEELHQQLPNCTVLLVDGEAFSWYGSRLMDTPEYLHQLHKSIFMMQLKTNH